MPIFMDRHDLPDLTAKDVAEAHKRDLEIQDRFNCRALTYWYDEQRNAAFCLIEAPNRQSVEQMHNQSHGMVPGNIIEVDTNLVESFLGRIDESEEQVRIDDYTIGFQKSARRTVMVAEIQNVPTHTYSLGLDQFYNFLGRCSDLVEEVVEQFSGNVITARKYAWISTFSSASAAVDCALEIIDRTSDMTDSFDAKNKLRCSVGLSAGDPVTQDDEMFGEAIQQAERFCRIIKNRPVGASSHVRNLYEEEELNRLSSTSHNLEILEPGEERFLSGLMDVMDKIWNREELTTRDLAGELGLSKSQIYRKITSITGMTPTELVKEIRLERAAQLIEQKEGNIAQIAYETGFSNPSYFSKCFRERYGVLPSGYKELFD